MVQLVSDRTSSRKAVANQMRLFLHTAAYWLLLTIRDVIPAAQALARAEFATIRLAPLKIAVRMQETASRVRLAFVAACPAAELFSSLVLVFTRNHRAKSSPSTQGPEPPTSDIQPSNPRRKLQ